MRLDAVMLADHASVAEGKLYIHGGGITRFQVPSLPFAIPTLSVILRFKPQPGDIGNHRIRLAFINPDGLQTLPPDPLDVAIGRGDGLLEGEEEFTQFVMSFAGLPLLAAGLHTLRISWDDDVLREFSIPVVLLEGAPVPTPNRAERRRQQRR